MTFRCGGQDFAFDILQVQRILRYEAPSPLPDAPDFLEGVLPYEGGAVPVVDLRKRLGLPATVTEETRVMVLELDGHRVGVVVDAVARGAAGGQHARSARRRRWSAGWRREYIAGILARPERTIVILNAQRLLADDERNGCAIWRSRRERDRPVPAPIRWVTGLRAARTPTSRGGWMRPTTAIDRDVLKREIIAFFKRVDGALTDLTQLKEEIRVLVDQYKQVAVDGRRGAGAAVHRRASRWCRPITSARRRTSKRAGA